MLDGILYGIIGGLFGPTIAKWLNKFKYTMIFLSAMILTHLGIFAVGAWNKGIQFALKSTIENTFTLVGILVPAGIGALAVFIAFVGSLGK